MPVSLLGHHAAHLPFTVAHLFLDFTIGLPTVGAAAQNDKFLVPPARILAGVVLPLVRRPVECLDCLFFIKWAENNYISHI